jgi:hypothetical protein
MWRIYQVYVWPEIQRKTKVDLVLFYKKNIDFLRGKDKWEIVFEFYVFIFESCIHRKKLSLNPLECRIFLANILIK